MRVLRWLLLVVALAVVALTIDPDRVGWSTAPVLAQAVGARVVLALLLAAIGVVCLVVMSRPPRRHRGRRRRPTGFARRVAAAVAAVVLIAAATAHLAISISRGVSEGEIPLAASERSGDLTVLTVNVRRGGDAVDVARLVDLVETSGADVVALAESSRGFSETLGRALTDAGLSFSLFDGRSSGSPAYGSALLVSEGLGGYAETPTEVAGVVQVGPVGHAGPGFATAHPPSLPLLPLGPGRLRETQRWASELRNVASIADAMPGGVVLGDLNATVDHGPLVDLPGGYVDAATVQGTGGFGTFPTWLPGALGTPIDHVLLDGDAWEVVTAGVRAVPGTDHRALVVRLAPR